MSRPTSAGVNRRSNSSAAANTNKTATTTNLYGYNVNTSNNVKPNNRPSSAGHSRPSGFL